jgi:hypothetical protein
VIDTNTTVIPAQAGIQKKILKLLDAGYPEGHTVKSGMTKIMDSRLRTLKGICDGNDKKVIYGFNI